MRLKRYVLFIFFAIVLQATAAFTLKLATQSSSGFFFVVPFSESVLPYYAFDVGIAGTRMVAGAQALRPLSCLPLPQSC